MEKPQQEGEIGCVHGRPQGQTCPHCLGVNTPITSEDWEKEFVEVGAALEHTRWSSWQKYLHSLCVKNIDGTLTIPYWQVERAERQISTPYKLLTEKEKESDRREVREYLPLIRNLFASHHKALEEKIDRQLSSVLEERDIKMRGYWKDVDRGFGGGYPAHWDIPIITLLKQQE